MIMRTFVSILFFASLFFISCSNNQSKKEPDKNSTELLEGDSDSKDIGEAKDCEEFIDQYEKWMDDYIKMIEKYMKNPTDATLLNEYLKLAQEGSSWMTQWNSKLYYCASKEKYQKRFDEITEKAEKKLKELGIE
jgi:Family of unknown function (DUF6591)